MVAEYTERSLPKGGNVSSFAPNHDNGRKAKSGRVVRKVCHWGRLPLFAKRNCSEGGPVRNANQHLSPGQWHIRVGKLAEMVRV